jgi:von Willebrand factor type A domain
MDTPNPSTAPQPQPLNDPPQPAAAPPQPMQQAQAAQPLPYQGIPGAQPPAVAIPAGPAMELPPLSFWQQPWVQNVLPLVTSLALHAAVVIVGILAWKTADLLANTKPLEEQIIVASSDLVEDAVAGGVQHVGLGADPTRPPAQDEYAESGDGWAPKPGDKNNLPALMGGGSEDSTDSYINQSPFGGGFGKGSGIGSGAGSGRGSGTGDGTGPLAPFGTPGGGGIGIKTKFMGSGGNARTVVFVCDASGSMINTFSSLKAELVKAVSRLKSIQGFNIIFFQDEKAAALDSGLLFATPENKRKAFQWLDTITTTGTTNPIPGVEMAFRNKPQLIYMLTDADFPDNNAVKAAVQRMNPGKQTRINTIIFVPGDDDDEASASFKELMKDIAKDNGGVFAHVKENELR